MAIFSNTQEMLNSFQWNKARETSEQDLSYDQYDEICEYVNNSLNDSADSDEIILEIMRAIDAVTTQFD